MYCSVKSLLIGTVATVILGVNVFFAVSRNFLRAFLRLESRAPIVETAREECAVRAAARGRKASRGAVLRFPSGDPTRRPKAGERIPAAIRKSQPSFFEASCHSESSAPDRRAPGEGREFDTVLRPSDSALHDVRVSSASSMPGIRWSSCLVGRNKPPADRSKRTASGAALGLSVAVRLISADAGTSTCSS